LLTAFFTTGPVVDYDSARRADMSLFTNFFQQLLSRGIYWPPSQFEAAFVSLAHTDDDIQKTIRAIREAFGKLSGQVEPVTLIILINPAIDKASLSILK
jgi:glutamate-1-semialdehyde aminotransferase